MSSAAFSTLARRAALCAVVMAVLSIGKSSIITSNEHTARSPMATDAEIAWTRRAYLLISAYIQIGGRILTG